MSVNQEGHPRVCAVCVTYNPGPELRRNLQSIRGQVDDVIVVDNGSPSGELDAESLGCGTIHILRQRQNTGVGRALNVGLELVEKRGYEWAVLLDQDSTPGPHMVEALGRAMLEHDRGTRLCAVAPEITSRIDHGSRTSVEGVDRITTAITSGSLVNVRVWRQVGGFREDFFIDYIDHEYCLRCGMSGYPTVLAHEAKLVHDIGLPVKRVLLGRKVIVTNHSPERRYYWARNRVFVWRRYWRRYWKWVINDLWRFLVSCVEVFVLEEYRFCKVKYIILGLVDGLIGRSGERVRL